MLVSLLLLARFNRPVVLLPYGLFFKFAPSKVVGIPKSGKFCLSNPESWALESGIHVKESGIPLTIDGNMVTCYCYLYYRVDMKVGSSVFLLLLLVELSPTLGRRKSTQAPGRKCRGGRICKYKIHEQSSRPVNVQLCGNDIIKAFRNVCRLGIRRKSKRGK